MGSMGFTETINNDGDLRKRLRRAHDWPPSNSMLESADGRDRIVVVE